MKLIIISWYDKIESQNYHTSTHSTINPISAQSSRKCKRIAESTNIYHTGTSALHTRYCRTCGIEAWVPKPIWQAWGVWGRRSNGWSHGFSTTLISKTKCWHSYYNTNIRCCTALIVRGACHDQGMRYLISTAWARGCRHGGQGRQTGIA